VKFKQTEPVFKTLKGKINPKNTDYFIWPL